MNNTNPVSKLTYTGPVWVGQFYKKNWFDFKLTWADLFPIKPAPATVKADRKHPVQLELVKMICCAFHCNTIFATAHT